MRGYHHLRSMQISERRGAHMDAQTKIWVKVNSAFGVKVDKVKGKGLSTNDYTAEDKEKVDNIQPIMNKEIDKLFV